MENLVLFLDEANLRVDDNAILDLLRRYKSKCHGSIEDFVSYQLSKEEKDKVATAGYELHDEEVEKLLNRVLFPRCYNRITYLAVTMTEDILDEFIEDLKVLLKKDLKVFTEFYKLPAKSQKAFTDTVCKEQGYDCVEDFYNNVQPRLRNVLVMFNQSYGTNLLSYYFYIKDIKNSLLQSIFNLSIIDASVLSQKEVHVLSELLEDVCMYTGISISSAFPLINGKEERVIDKDKVLLLLYENLTKIKKDTYTDLSELNLALKAYTNNLPQDDGFFLNQCDTVEEHLLTIAYYLARGCNVHSQIEYYLEGEESLK